MKTRIFFFIIIIILCRPSPSRSADGIFVETGPGFDRSLNTGVVLARYVKDTSPLWGYESFYEGIYARWSGRNHAEDFSVSRGLRWRAGEVAYYSFAMGGGHISRVTGNLGTPFDFYFRFAYGRRTSCYDISLGVIHISNGKPLFGWPGPDNGENFITFAVGGLF